MSPVLASFHAAHGRPPRIAILVAGGPLAAMFVNAVRRHFGDVAVLKEEHESKWAIVRRRARMLGWPQALGQAAFGVLAKLIARSSNARLAEIWHSYNMDPRPHCGHTWRPVGSVNSPACRQALVAFNPDVVMVYGTRIIKGETLRCVRAPFINYHAGYNPLYRGQHGAYWARTVGDHAHSGITIHLVDEGVDTGEVLYQAVSDFSCRDNITTYQFRQMADAIPLSIRAIEDALAGTLTPKHVPLPSKQWFMPTLWGYCGTGLRTGVW